MSDVARGYLDTWNATDEQERRVLLERYFAETVSYVDPLAVARGRDELEATIVAVQTQFPGFVFTPLGEPDAHHDQVRFRWGLGPAGAEPVVVGADVVVTGADGRIDQVLGFLDVVPA